ncbi:MAG: type III secretion protein [Gemmatimonadaceae bacterium]|jgi:hypothetical protein|nr:type III secretion protein [Gemmatimonadaceae bacterium]
MTMLRDDLIVVAIDGSAPGGPPFGVGAPTREEYETRMATSFVRQLHDRSRVAHFRRTYLQGPGMFAGGIFTPNIATLSADARTFINIFTRAGRDRPKLFLTGWSRGAAACIQVALDLQAIGMGVECMALFDAVDQDTSTGWVPWSGANLSIIPSNVKHCFHAISARTPRRFPDGVVFPISGRQAAGGVRFALRAFDASHSSIGGLPGITYARKLATGAAEGLADSSLARTPLTAAQREAVEARRQQERAAQLERERQASEQVRAWMWGQLAPLGLIVG